MIKFGAIKLILFIEAISCTRMSSQHIIMCFMEHLELLMGMLFNYSWVKVIFLKSISTSAKEDVCVFWMGISKGQKRFL